MFGSGVDVNTEYKAIISKRIKVITMEEKDDVAINKILMIIIAKILQKTFFFISMARKVFSNKQSELFFNSLFIFFIKRTPVTRKMVIGIMHFENISV